MSKTALYIYINIILYLSVSLVVWDVSWIKDMGEWCGFSRFFFLALFVSAQLMIFAINIDSKRAKW